MTFEMSDGSFEDTCVFVAMAERCVPIAYRWICIIYKSVAPGKKVYQNITMVIETNTDCPHPNTSDER
jgi:hypothetical protein